MKNGSLYWRPSDWVLEITSVWRDTKLIVLTAQVAAIYAAILIPFKVGIPIIPGFVELRPANAIPIVSSLLFGPVAAWGAGIGNIIGDCFGTLGPASVFGFLGNFFLGYIPHVMWGNLGPLSSGRPPDVKSWGQGFEFAVICMIASGVCAATIAWGVELLGLLPFMILAPAIFLNNVVMGMFLGPPLLLFLYPRVKRWGLYYQDLSEELREVQDDSHARVPFESMVHDSPATKEMLPMVEMQHVNFRYRSSKEPALRDLSLHIQQGEWVAVMGARGSGKSTLCQSLNRLIPRFAPGEFSGTIKINGMPNADLPVSSYAGMVGLVFQDFDTQLISSNVEREIAHPLEYLEPSIPLEKMKERINWAMHQVALQDFASRDPLTLSGGQRQRLVLASVLASFPSLLVLDQPMTDIDPKARKQLQGLIDRLREQGATILLSEQEVEEVLHADRLLILDHGSICWEGTPREFFQCPDLARRYGISSLPLAECFADFGLSALPVTVEEAWQVTDELGLKLESTHDVHTAGYLVTDQPAGRGAESPLVCLKSVSFGYVDSMPVLKDVSLSIAQGEFVAVLGENGSGKSTLSKLLNGLLLPTKGEVVVGGHNTKTTSMRELSRVVGYVFQNPDHQIFAETVWDEVGFSVRNHGFSTEECDRRIVEAITAVGLDADHSQFQDPFSLTKGERQRVAVASILAMKPDLLIFDEPTTGLDIRETDRMMDTIYSLHQQGHTIIIITHTIELVAKYATRCVLMNEHTILADGATRSIFSDPSLLQAASLAVPSLTRFSQRWGQTLLTIEEVKSSFKSL